MITLGGTSEGVNHATDVMPRAAAKPTFHQCRISFWRNGLAANCPAHAAAMPVLPVRPTEQWRSR